VNLFSLFNIILFLFHIGMAIWMYYAADMDKALWHLGWTILFALFIRTDKEVMNS